MGKKKTKIAIACLLLLCIGLSTFTGCVVQEQTGKGKDVKSRSGEQENFILTPKAKADGKPYRIAIVDVDEYAPASVTFYQMLEELKKWGWLDYDSLPFTQDQFDIKTMVQRLSGMDLGPYIQFDENLCYYLEYEGEEQVAQELAKEINSKEGVDLILAMGTEPGLFVKSLGLKIPVVDPFATDPIASGIIQPKKESKNSNIWALVEPDTYGRQLKLYHQMIPFQRLGVVVKEGEEEISGLPAYEKEAAALHVKVITKRIKESSDENQYYDNLSGLYKELISQDHVDAYLLTIDVIKDEKRCDELFSLFNKHKIPIFVSDGNQYVQQGAFMSVTSFDYGGYGRMMGDAIASIFNGCPAGSLPYTYISSPYISINMDTAKRLGFPTTLEFLLACENIYGGDEQHE